MYLDMRLLHATKNTDLSDTHRKAAEKLWNSTKVERSRVYSIVENFHDPKTMKGDFKERIDTFSNLEGPSKRYTYNYEKSFFCNGVGKCGASFEQNMSCLVKGANCGVNGDGFKKLINKTQDFLGCSA